MWQTDETLLSLKGKPRRALLPFLSVQEITDLGEILSYERDFSSFNSWEKKSSTAGLPEDGQNSSGKSAHKEGKLVVGQNILNRERMS